MKSSSTPRHRLSSSPTRFAALLLILGLTTAAVAMAATSYTRTARIARHAMTESAQPISSIQGSWQPPGCMFASASTFSG